MTKSTKAEPKTPVKGFKSTTANQIKSNKTIGSAVKTTQKTATKTD